MISTVHPLGSLGDYRYVVVLSRRGGKILLSRHKDRTTWETQGGHIEAGETPEEAARRELYEESGALRYTLAPLFDYRVKNDGVSTNGMVFSAVIEETGKLPESEMAEVKEFDALPDELTYKDITPVLFEHYERTR